MRGWIIGAVALGACTHALGACTHGPRPSVGPPPFPDAFVAAVDAHDGGAAAALFASDGDVAVSAGAAVHGRAAIAAAFDAVFARFDGLHVTLGRQWIGRDVSVLELVVTARREGKPIGVAAAAVVRFDVAQRVSAARLYIDVPTIVGQVDPRRLPEGARTRTPISAPPAGTAVARTTGSAAEAAHLATADASWAGLDAHDPTAILAAAAPGYVYDDLSGPAPLDAAGTRALLERWLGMVPDFRIAAEPTHFAAGDDVITESVEEMTFRGRKVRLEGLDIKHFEDGRVVHEWQYANGAGVLEGLLGIPLAAP